MPKMQKLKELLNTGYIVAFYRGYKENDYIGIGSGYIHGIIRMDCVTLKVSYPGDENEDGLIFPELIAASKKLKALISSGDIRNIIDGNDDPEINNIEVFYEENGDILSTFCEKPGWPNTTITGELMYENSHYPTGKAAAENSYDPDDKYFGRELERIDEMIKEFQEKIKAQKEWKQNTIDRRRKLKEYLKEC